MAETDERTVGRILDYQLSNPSEFVADFKRRVEEQIDVLRIGIKNDSVNDAKISENYAKKAERFLQIPYFSEKKNKKKRVYDLKKMLKVTVAVDKEIAAIIEAWVTQKRRNKVILADKYTPAKAIKYFSYYDEMCKFYVADMDFFSTYKTSYSSERIVINRLLGLLTDEDLMKNVFSFKNSWKVETFKKALQQHRKDLSQISDAEFEEIMRLPYFKYKRYLTMECDEFKDLIKIRSEALMHIEGWIDEQHFSACQGREHLCEINSEILKKATLLDVFDKYDDDISGWTDAKRDYEKEYSLYRFGQGLIEADIFASLYK